MYLCSANSIDTDGDTICDDAERRYGTNPELADTDGDNISDAAELFGFGGLDLRAYGADPLRKDIFVEIDYYPGLRPMDEAIDDVVTAFAFAPVDNPDGSTGITLHIVIDEEIPASDADVDLNPVWEDFDRIKNQYFAPERANFFHYGLFANLYNGASTGLLSTGASRSIPGHDLSLPWVVGSLTQAAPPASSREQALCINLGIILAWTMVVILRWIAPLITSA